MFKFAAVFLHRSLAGKENRVPARRRFVFHVKQPCLSFHVEQSRVEVSQFHLGQ